MPFLQNYLCQLLFKDAFRLESELRQETFQFQYETAPTKSDISSSDFTTFRRQQTFREYPCAPPS